GRFRSIQIGWFGGEPLLWMNVIRELTQGFHSLAREFGCPYKAKVVTNGLSLTHELATELIEELDVYLIEITIDGTAEYHHARRHTKGLGPTFDTIYANMADLARRADPRVKLTVRCNVDRQNAEGVVPLLEKMAADGLQDKIAGFYVALVHAWGNDADKR